MVLAELVSNNIESRPKHVTGMIDRITQTDGIVFRAQKTEISCKQLIAGFDILAAHVKNEI